MIITRNEFNFQTIRNLQLVINGEDLDNELNNLFKEYNKLVSLANNITTKPIIVTNPLKLNNLLFKNIGDGNINLAKIDQRYINNVILDFSKFDFLINKKYNFNQFSKNNLNGEPILLDTIPSVINTNIIKNELKFITNRAIVNNFASKSLKLQNFKKKSITKSKFKSNTIFRQIADDFITNDLIADNTLFSYYIKEKSLTIDIIDNDLRQSRKEAIQKLNNFTDDFKFYFTTNLKNEHFADKLLQQLYTGDAVNYGKPRPNSGQTDGYTGKLNFSIIAPQTFNTKNIANKSLDKINFIDNDISGKRWNAFDIFYNNLIKPRTLSKLRFFSPAVLVYNECIDWEHLDDELYNLWRPYYKQPIA